MNKPLDLGFNIAVRTIAARLFPCGFDITADESAAPSTLEALQAHIEATGRMLVWSGASDHTIFACPETNWAFRAWHDWAHWRYALPFDLAGERAVCEVQKANLATVYPGRPSLPLWGRILDLEITAQAEHFTTTGSFPIDQVAFTLARLAA
jgi:hypothetical protein